MIALTALVLSVGPLPAGADTSPVHRVRSPSPSFSLSVPYGWRYKNESYPSDHQTFVWISTDRPRARATVTFSGCLGCVRTTDGRPDPLAPVPNGATDIRRVGSYEVLYSGPTLKSERGYIDSGLVYVTYDRARPVGFLKLDVWLPPSNRRLAQIILRDFHPTR